MKERAAGKGEGKEMRVIIVSDQPTPNLPSKSSPKTSSNRSRGSTKALHRLKI